MIQSQHSQFLGGNFYVSVRPQADLHAVLVQTLVQHWIKYDWRAEEAKLNQSLHHFKMPVNTIDLHFVHERSQHENAIPLILIHGWPGSILEFTEIIPQLVSPGQHQLSVGW